MHAHEVYAHEMYPRKMHARKILAKNFRSPTLQMVWASICRDLSRKIRGFALREKRSTAANISLSHLPLELLGLILANIFPDEWDRYDSGFEVLNLRIVCRKYSKRVF
jgi:hypothetical protein